jgi:hypothetical protein
MNRLLPLAALLAALALGQTNLKFQQGVAGQVPPGWFVLEAVKDAGYTAAWQQEECRAGLACASLAAPASPPPGSFGALMESFDAQAFRGKKVRLSAWIRLDRKAPADHARMLLHVGRPGLQQGFVDNMADRPIVSEEWRRYEIQGEVAPDAETIRIGVTLDGLGRVWVSEVEFGLPAEETSGPAVDAARDAIQKQYARVDAAFVRGDGSEIGAVLMPGAQIGVGTIREPLLPAIEGEIAKGSKLTARTVVSALRLDGDEAVAVVRREAADPLLDGKRSVVTEHRDTWIQTATGWRWRESIEVSYHWLLPPTGADAARPVVAELKARAVKLSGAGDLAAFGAAVGDARLVLLGEAAHGTREFPQVKQRLVEYLVKEKGFTVVAAANDAEVRDPVERLGVTFAAFEGATAEAMANSVTRLANASYPKAKMVLWTDNAHARFSANGDQGMGAWLREKFGRRVYVAGFAFRRGEVRAVGVEGGESRGLNAYLAPASPEGSGDAVLSAAGMPQFFLDMAGLPGNGALARWLAEAHLFHDLGAYWVLDDPEASLQPEELSKCYDGIFFVEEVHAGG